MPIPAVGSCLRSIVISEKLRFCSMTDEAFEEQPRIKPMDGTASRRCKGHDGVDVVALMRLSARRSITAKLEADAL